jgi:hypothetical protein
MLYCFKEGEFFSAFGSNLIERHGAIDIPENKLLIENSNHFKLCLS